MPSKFVTDWGNAYNKANVAFAKDWNTGHNGDKAAGKALKTMLQSAIDTGPLLNALAEIDKIDIGTPNDAKLKLYKAAQAKLAAAQAKYDKALAEAQALKPAVKDKNGYQLPTPIKDAYPDTYRQLKILQTEVKAIVERSANALHSAETAGKVDKITTAKNAKNAKVQGADAAANAKIKDNTADAAMQIFLVKFVPSFKSSMAKGAAVIQKIKAKPDVATYNAEMNDGGRDISQNLVNIAKLKADAKYKSSSLARKLPDPGPMAATIVPFANGAKRSLPQTASADDVKAALAEFTTLYKQIATAYHDVLSGKVK